VAAHACDAELRAKLTRIAADAGERALALGQTGRHAGGPPNLWMAGILDDSERDVRSTAAGPLLDTAMIGAVRKAVSADRVSYETAVALAENELRAVLEKMRNALVATDGQLAVLLARVAAV